MNVLDEGYVNQTSIMKILSQVLRENFFNVKSFLYDPNAMPWLNGAWQNQVIIEEKAVQVRSSLC